MLVTLEPSFAFLSLTFNTLFYDYLCIGLIYKMNPYFINATHISQDDPCSFLVIWILI